MADNFPLHNAVRNGTIKEIRDKVEACHPSAILLLDNGKTAIEYAKSFQAFKMMLKKADPYTLQGNKEILNWIYDYNPDWAVHILNLKSVERKEIGSEEHLLVRFMIPLDMVLKLVDCKGETRLLRHPVVKANASKSTINCLLKSGSGKYRFFRTSRKQVPRLLQRQNLSFWFPEHGPLCSGIGHDFPRDLELDGTVDCHFWIPLGSDV